METKKEYISPQLNLVVLDYEISLVLESSPPIGPEELLNNIKYPFEKETGLV